MEDGKEQALNRRIAAIRLKNEETMRKHKVEYVAATRLIDVDDVVQRRRDRPLIIGKKSIEKYTDECLYMVSVRTSST